MELHRFTPEKGRVKHVHGLRAASQAARAGGRDGAHLLGFAHKHSFPLPFLPLLPQRLVPTTQKAAADNPALHTTAISPGGQLNNQCPGGCYESRRCSNPLGFTLNLLYNPCAPERQIPESIRGHNSTGHRVLIFGPCPWADLALGKGEYRWCGASSHPTQHILFSR